MIRRPTKRILAVAALVVAASCGLGFVYWATYRQLPFDATVWRRSPATSLARYRMSDDLLRKVQSERWTASEAIAALGPDDNLVTSFSPGRTSALSYRFRVPVQPTNKYLRLVFDADGNLVDAAIFVD